MGKRKGQRSPQSMSVWGMLRDVLVTSMNKGQFPLAIAALIVIVSIVKMPGEDVSRLVFEILGEIKTGRLVGYILATVILAGWFAHAKWQRRHISHEMQRIAQERTRWQEQQLNRKLESSES